MGVDLSGKGRRTGDLRGLDEKRTPCSVYSVQRVKENYGALSELLNEGSQLVPRGGIHETTRDAMERTETPGNAPKRPDTTAKGPKRLKPHGERTETRSNRTKHVSNVWKLTETAPNPKPQSETD